MNTPSDKKVNVGFSIALAVWVFISAFSYVNITRLAATTQREIHTHEVLTALEEILSLLKDVETGTRGYTITGNDDFLAPCKTALATINPGVERLASLVADNPRQQQRLAQFAPLIAEKITITNEIADLRRHKGFEAAQQLILTQKGKSSMYKIRKLTDDMKQEETLLLSYRVKNSESAARITAFTIIAGNIFACVLAGLSYIVYRNSAGKRNRLHEELRNNEARTSAILNTTVDGIITIDEHGVIESFNLAAEKIFGYTRSEVVGRNVKMLMPEPYHSRHDGYLANYLRTGVRKIIGIGREVAGKRKDGAVFPIELSVSEVRLNDRRIFTGIIRDVSKRKHLEEEIQKLSKAIEQSPMIAIITDPKGNIEYVNPKFTQLTGYTAAEALGQNPRMLKSGETPPEEYKRLWDAITAGDNWQGDLHNRKKNGELYWASAVISPVRNQDGAITHFLGLTEDITERKRMEEVLKRSEEQIRLLLSSTAEAIYGIDLSGNCTFCNPSCVRILGYNNQEQIIGKNMHALIHHTREDGTPYPVEECFIYRAFHEEQNIHIDKEVFWRADGTSFPAEYWSYPVKLTGKTIGAVVTFLDITERKQAEEKLRKAKESADAATRAKSDFLANMSHEIRTPMNAIIGMTELALNTELTHEQRGYLKTVQSSSESLLCLINDILDFSRVEAGRMEIDAVNFNLRELVERVAEVLNTRAAEKGIELICFIEPGIPALLTGDPNRLRQILINLVGNAIKFTEKGEVVVSVERADDSDSGKIHFMVSDTGIGISRANQEKLFEKFSQVDTSITRRYGGTGLGLSITKALVELMGGNIRVESEEGKGSTFHFCLPFNIQKRISEKTSFVFPDAKTVQTLVVDDNRTNRFILQKMLSAWGFQVKEADGGTAALSLLRDKTNRFDVIILDHQMPGVAGLELAKIIRKEPGIDAVKIIMLSSLGRLNTQLMLEYGIDDSLAKPVRQATLIETLMKVLLVTQKEEKAPAPAKPVESAPKRTHLKILLAEDNVDNQRLAKTILDKAGYPVDVAENGKAAAETVRASHYDLILMDIQMPEMDGFEATNIIRQWEKEANAERIPIIALTAHAVQGYREKCLEGGMDDYITKPMKKSILLDVVGKWIDPRPAILAVDDSIDNRNLIANYLKRETTLRLYFAKNGQEALDASKRRIFSLILMDMEMPVMDGYTAATAIRALEGAQNVPIIAMTAHQGSDEMRKCMNAGCSDYLSKPIRKDGLLKIIYKYVTGERQEARS